jgi:hypothetical protein
MIWKEFGKERPEYNRWVVYYPKIFAIPVIGKLLPPDEFDWRSEHWCSVNGLRRTTYELDKWIYFEMPED